MLLRNSFPIIMLKEIIKGSAIGSSNQAMKWAALLARSHAVSDSAARCGITIAGQPDCLYAWHRALARVAAWGLFMPSFASPKRQLILNSRISCKLDIKQIPQSRSLPPLPANRRISRQLLIGSNFGDSSGKCCWLSSAITEHLNILGFPAPLLSSNIYENQKRFVSLLSQS